MKAEVLKFDVSQICKEFRNFEIKQNEKFRFQKSCLPRNIFPRNFSVIDIYHKNSQIKYFEHFLKISNVNKITDEVQEIFRKNKRQFFQETENLKEMILQKVGTLTKFEIKEMKKNDSISKEEKKQKS